MLRVENLEMESSESYQSTTEFNEVSTASDSNVLPESFTTTMLLSKVSEALTETYTDPSTPTEWTTSSRNVSISDLKFSVVDYSVFGIMLAASGEINYSNEFLEIVQRQKSICSFDWSLFRVYCETETEQHHRISVGRKANEFLPYRCVINCESH